MKVKIKIPSSLNDITLQQYKRYMKIQEKVKDDRFLNAKMIEIFMLILIPSYFIGRVLLTVIFDI